MNDKRFKNHFNGVLSGISDNGRQLTQDEVVNTLNYLSESNERYAKSIVKLTLLLKEFREKCEIYEDMIEEELK